jgi:hypothetical protein
MLRVYVVIRTRVRLPGSARRAPADTATITLLGRAGDIDRARRWRREHEPDLSDVSSYASLSWALAAEAAAYVDDRDLAARAHELLTPLAGMLAIGGTGCAVGPIDSFLAMAAYVTGEHELARRHADEAPRCAGRGGSRWSSSRCSTSGSATGSEPG